MFKLRTASSPVETPLNNQSTVDIILGKIKDGKKK